MALYRTSHRVAAFEHATVDRAIPEGNDDLRIRRLFVDILQCALHVDRDRSGHDQRVRMPWRRGNVNAEPLNVIDRISQGVHLHLAGVAGACVHFANRQGLSEWQRFLASLRREAFRRLRGLGMLSRHHSGLQTLLENTEHVRPPRYRSFPAYERLKLLLMSGKSGMMFPTT